MSGGTTRWAILGGTAAMVAIAAGAACTDLFHSTSDLENACDLDASTPGCVTVDGGTVTDAPGDRYLDFCAWSSTEANTHATQACAWLGACETPLGRNAFGSCMVSAVLAYDCQANPNRQVKGKAHVFWQCLAEAKTCGDVHRCVFPISLQCNSGDFTGCNQSNADTRGECHGPDSSALGENCAGWGQTCAPNGASADCAGDPTGASGCMNPGCSGTLLRDCDGGNVGVDCASYGAGQCTATISADGGWAACLAERGAPCTPTAAVTCNGTIALGCPSGVEETIDCQAIVKVDGGSCHNAGASPIWDVSSVCYSDPPDACPGESCAGTILRSCARGALFTIDCTTVQLGPCRLVGVEDDASVRAACTAPPP